MEKNILRSTECVIEKYFYFNSIIIVLFALVFDILLRLRLNNFWTPGRGFLFNSGLPIFLSIRKSDQFFLRKQKRDLSDK